MESECSRAFDTKECALPECERSRELRSPRRSRRSARSTRAPPSSKASPDNVFAHQTLTAQAQSDRSAVENQDRVWSGRESRARRRLNQSPPENHARAARSEQARSGNNPPEDIAHGSGRFAKARPAGCWTTLGRVRLQSAECARNTHAVR